MLSSCGQLQSCLLVYSDNFTSFANDKRRFTCWLVPLLYEYCSFVSFASVQTTQTVSGLSFEQAIPARIAKGVPERSRIVLIMTVTTEADVPMHAQQGIIHKWPTRRPWNAYMPKFTPSQHEEPWTCAWSQSGDRTIDLILHNELPHACDNTRAEAFLSRTSLQAVQHA